MFFPTTLLPLGCPSQTLSGWRGTNTIELLSCHSQAGETGDAVQCDSWTGLV